MIHMNTNLGTFEAGHCWYRFIFFQYCPLHNLILGINFPIFPILSKHIICLILYNFFPQLVLWINGIFIIVVDVGDLFPIYFMGWQYRHKYNPDTVIKVLFTKEILISQPFNLYRKLQRIFFHILYLFFLEYIQCISRYYLLFQRGQFSSIYRYFKCVSIKR